MDKKEAIRRARLNGEDIRFANINSGKDVWWLHIPLAKVDRGGVEEINLLLVDDRSKELHHLRIPSDYLRANMSHLHIRVDKQCISLELATDGPALFQNVSPADSGVHFERFKARTIQW